MTTQTETTPAIALRYQARLDEQMEAARRYQASTRKHQIYRVISVLALAAGAWSIFVAPSGLVLAGIWLLLALFMWFDPVPLLVIWLSFRSPAALRQQYEARFDDKGAHFQIGDQRVDRPWERYQRVLETKRVFALVYGPWSYSVIPKRAFAQEADVDAFRALLKRMIRR